MKPLTDEIPKALVKVAGKTLLEWAIDRYIQSEISNIVIAVGWKGFLIEDYVASSNLDVSIVHVPNYEVGPLKTLLAALETFDGDFLLSPVDAVLEPESVMGIQRYHSGLSDFEGMILAVRYDAESGTRVMIDEDGLVSEIGVNRPKIGNLARSAMMLIGNTRVKGLAESVLLNGKTKVVQLLEQLIAQGTTIRAYNLSQPFFDIDTLSDLLMVNAYLLQRRGVEGQGSIFIPSGDMVEIGDALTLKTNINLGKGTTLRGPVMISSNCEIGENCSIGPNVTIDSNAVLSESCEISDSIIFGESRISSQMPIHKSVIYRSTEYRAKV